jgi:hypothetical protein
MSHGQPYLSSAPMNFPPTGMVIVCKPPWRGSHRDNITALDYGGFALPRRYRRGLVRATRGATEAGELSGLPDGISAPAGPKQKGHRRSLSTTW